MKKFILIAIFSIVTISSFAQSASKTIRGNVKLEDGGPATGAKVVDKKAPTHGTLVDLDGNFSLIMPESHDEIEISLIGYIPLTIDVSVRRTVNATLHKDVVEYIYWPIMNNSLYINK